MQGLLVLLLVGWGVAWFLCRSHAGEVLIRRPVAAFAAVPDAVRRNLNTAFFVDRLVVLVAVVGFSPWRIPRAALECPGCTGFWIGAGCGWWLTLQPQALLPILNLLPTPGALPSQLVPAFACGAMVMGTNALLAKALDLLEQSVAFLWRRNGPTGGAG